MPPFALRKHPRAAKCTAHRLSCTENHTGNDKTSVPDPAPTDEPAPLVEPAATDPTIFEPIAARADSKKAWTKVVTKEPISIMLLIRATCGDREVVEEPSMECLQELESAFDYGEELQRQRADVAVKLREIKAPVYPTLGKQGTGGG